MTAVRLLAAALATAALAAASIGLGDRSPGLAVAGAAAGFPLLAGLAARSRPDRRHG